MLGWEAALHKSICLWLADNKLTLADYGSLMLMTAPKTRLEHDLQSIVENIIRMLSMVRESTELAHSALIKGDNQAARACSQNDVVVDALQVELEQHILNVLESRRLKSKELRFLTSMNRSLADIERAGDYAEHIAKTALKLDIEHPVKKYHDLNHIFGLLNTMLELAIKALAESNETIIEEIFDIDNEIDDLYTQIQRELITLMIEDPKLINLGTHLLNISRFLERLGDHIVNVGEHIIFWRTARRI